LIIVVNGPLGIGKSETSWQLMYQLPQSVMLDMDYVACAFHSFNYYHQDHIDYSYATLRLLVEHHVRQGFSHFIINGVFESAEQLNRMHAVLSDLSLPFYAFRLRCDLEEIISRIRKRNRPDLDREIHRCGELVSILEEAAQKGDMGTVIDTTALTPEQAANEILASLQTALRT
jgi:deoxyadenosine/deoxycytidine kinase